MNIVKASIPLVALAVFSTPIWAQMPFDPFDVVPYRNPQQLQQLADLDDTQFQRLLAENNGERFRAIVAPFDPPDNAVFPVSHGFQGPRQACLRARAVQACRLYTIDLLTVQREKESRAATASTNPFGTPAR